MWLIRSEKHRNNGNKHDRF